MGPVLYIREKKLFMKMRAYGCQIWNLYNDPKIFEQNVLGRALLVV
jgi:hypothetical protein